MKTIYQNMFLCLAIALGMSSCQEDKEYTTGMTENQLVNNIELKVSETLPLLVGTDSTIVYRIEPENVTDKHLKWSSTNELVATVDQDGTIHGIGIGEAVITVTPSLGFGHSGSTLRSITVKVIPEVIKATAIQFGNESHELYVGDKMQLEYSILPENHTYSYLTWSSSDENIASVDENGLVRGNAVGNVKIYAHTHDKSGTVGVFDLRVKQVVPAEDVKILPFNDVLYMGQTIQLQTELTPIDASPSSITWTSSNTKILTVEDGKVTAKGWGTAMITASCNKTGKRYNITLTVDSGFYMWNAEYGFDQWYTPTAGAKIEVKGGQLVATINSSRRADLNINCSKTNNFFINFYKYPVIAMKVHITPGAVFTFNCANNDNTISESPRMKAETLSDGSQLVYVNETKMQTYTDLIGLRVFAIKVVSIPGTDLTYQVDWIRTFKSVDDMHAYAK